MPLTTEAITKSRVLICDTIDHAGIDILKTFAEVDVKTKLSEEEIITIIGEYDAVVVRSATKITKKIIDAGERLQIVGRAGVGIDNVDVPAATEKGVFVVNSPQGNTIAAAEHTLALMLTLARHIPSADSSIRSGKWQREQFMGTQLQLKTLGIVGLGQVGSHVARVAHEMGMSLLTYDPYVNEKKAEALDCRVVGIEDLVKLSDYITLHVPLSPDTKHLINEERIAMMKKSVRIVNCSRGGVVDEAALCKALTEGRIGGAALDVFEVEKAFEASSPLLSAPNLVLTPHLGASTTEAQVNVAVDVAQQILEALKGRLPQSAVNIPGLRSTRLQNLLPVLKCCETLGKLAIQLLDGPLEEIVTTLEGGFAIDNEMSSVESLLLAAASGAIGVHTAQSRVNFVNVRQIAELHKIKMTVVKNCQTDKSTIKVEVRSTEKSAIVKGTITDDNEVLLKAFDDVAVYLILPSIGSGSSKQMIYSRHDDVPGVLANITSALSAASINIGNCHLGRSAKGGAGRALAVFLVDSVIPSGIITTLRAMAPIRECLLIKL